MRMASKPRSGNSAISLTRMISKRAPGLSSKKGSPILKASKVNKLNENKKRHRCELAAPVHRHPAFRLRKICPACEFTALRSIDFRVGAGVHPWNRPANVKSHFGLCHYHYFWYGKRQCSDVDGSFERCIT